MAYNIILADPQEFTASLDNTLYFQPWKVDLLSPVRVYHVLGQAAPAAVVGNLSIENVFRTQPAGVYSSFHIHQLALWWSGPTPNTGFVGLSAPWAGVPFPGFEITEATLQHQFSIFFQNMNLVTPGRYSWVMNLGIHGVRQDSGAYARFLTQLDLPFELEILPDDEIMADTDHLHQAHIIGQPPLPGQAFEVITGNKFWVDIPNHFLVTGGNIVEIEGDYLRRKFMGTGRQALTLTLVQGFDEFEGGVYRGSMNLKADNPYGRSTRPGAHETYTVELSAYLLEAHGFIVDPEAMEFFSIKDVSEAEAQLLEVTCTETFSVQAPYWLTVTPDPTGNYARLSVKPISSENLVEGEYLGVITLTSANASIEVPVQLRVAESIDEAFSTTGLNFTDDNAEFSYLYSTNPAERASVVLGISAYNYRGFAQVAEHTFKRTFFKSRADLHLGEIVARRLQQLSLPSDIRYRNYDLESEAPELFRILPYYRPASANVAFSIEDRSSGEVSKSRSFSGVLYVGGRRPKKFSADYGILNYEAVPVRVTEKSQLLFNFVRRYSTHLIRVYRNNAIYKTITHAPGNNSLFGLAMIFKDFTPGDVIDVRLETEGFEQKYLMFPPQKHSNHIVFENEYRVPEAYEFTGAFVLKSGYENITATTYKQLVETLENLESRKEQRLVINTGWILKSNAVIIDAILRSRRAWLVKGDKEISLVPVSRELVSEDSQQQLYQYDVEFVVNRVNEMEVVSSS